MALKSTFLSVLKCKRTIWPSKQAFNHTQTPVRPRFRPFTKDRFRPSSKGASEVSRTPPEFPSLNFEKKGREGLNPKSVIFLEDIYYTIISYSMLIISKNLFPTTISPTLLTTFYRLPWSLQNQKPAFHTLWKSSLKPHTRRHSTL